MTTAVLSIPSQQYTPGPFNFNASMPAGVKQVIVQFTLSGWPLGNVFDVEIDYPNGKMATDAVFAGNGTDNNGRGGNTVGITIGDGRDVLPSGSYTVKGTVDQTFDTAITILMT